MPIDLPIIQGAAADYPLQTWNRGDISQAAYAAGDSLTAFVYQGNNLASLFSPTVAWFTGIPSGGQNGYDQGQVLVSISNAQSATLEPNGVYTLIVQWSPVTQPGKTAPIARATLSVEPAPGTATQAVTTYCSLADMLMHADWIKICQNVDVDGEGFYSQRIQARQWLDWAIINGYRGASWGQFEYHSMAAFNFAGGGGNVRTMGPSPPIIAYLAANNLILRPDVIRACAYKAIAVVGQRQVGINNQLAGLGQMFEDRASRALIAITAEIDTNGDGVGEFFINLSATNTLRT